MTNILKSTRLATVSDGEIASIGPFSTLYPTQPLPVNEAWLSEHSAYVVKNPPYDRVTQSTDGIALYDSVLDTVLSGTVSNKSDAVQVSAVRLHKMNTIRTKKTFLQNYKLRFEGIIYEIDPDSKALVNNAITLNGQVGSPGGTHGGGWQPADSAANPTPMTDAQLIAFGLAIGAYVVACFKHKLLLKAQLNAATTLTEINAIDVQAGWPDNGVPDTGI